MTVFTSAIENRFTEVFVAGRERVEEDVGIGLNLTGGVEFV
jgi:hypothetical protein